MLRVGLPSQADAMAARKRLQPPRTRPKGGRSFLPVAWMTRPSHGDTKKSRRHTLPFGSAQRVCCKYLFLGEWKTAPAARMERKTRPVCLGCCASNSHFAHCPLRHQALVYAKPPRHSLQGRGALACFLSLLQSAEFVDNLQLKRQSPGYTPVAFTKATALWNAVLAELCCPHSGVAAQDCSYCPEPRCLPLA